METLTRNNSKAEQQELKDMYRDILKAEVWKDQRMVDYCLKEACFIVRLSNGDILPIDKEKIETSFCFGYSDSRYNTEDYDRANNMADYAKKSEDHFMSENLEGINRRIAQLDGTEHTRYKFSLRSSYTGQPKNSKLKHLEMFDPWNGEQAQEISEEDRALILAGYAEVKRDFEKRLQQYLKRYGMSKIKTWSYWRDE